MKLFFRKTGEGYPLIILHGLFGMSDNWASLARQYAADGFAVYTPDLRNHGHSPHDEIFNHESMAADVLDLMDNENISVADVVGHSLGGKVAMYLACSHSPRVSKLVVCDMATRQYPPNQEDVLAALHAVDPGKVNSRSEAEKEMEKFLPAAGTRQFLLKSLHWEESAQGKKLAWRFNLPVIEKELKRAVEALPVAFRYDGPVLFIRGERSDYVTPKDYNSILHHFPHARIETVPNAGHWVHADNPKDFSEVLLKFLL